MLRRHTPFPGRKRCRIARNRAPWNAGRRTRGRIHRDRGCMTLRTSRHCRRGSLRCMSHRTLRSCRDLRPGRHRRRRTRRSLQGTRNGPRRSSGSARRLRRRLHSGADHCRARRTRGCSPSGPRCTSSRTSRDRRGTRRRRTPHCSSRSGPGRTKARRRLPRTQPRPRGRTAPSTPDPSRRGLALESPGPSFLRTPRQRARPSRGVRRPAWRRASAGRVPRTPADQTSGRIFSSAITMA